MAELGVTRSQWPGDAAVVPFPARSVEASGAAGAALATETSAAGSVTGLAGLAAQLTTLDGRVDGLETLIGSTNTKLDTLITALGTANGHLANIKTNTDRIP